MSILEVKNVSVSFEDQIIINGVSFVLEKGEALAIIGPNGSGKTTLLKAILGSIKYSGEIIKTGVRIGYVPQKLDIDRNLPLTVKEFFSLIHTKKLDENYTDNRVLEFVGFDQEYANKKFSNLSAGEFQRILIAAAILSKPNLLIFDEPTASVDAAGQETVYELLHRLQTKENVALILISHDPSVVYQYANNVLCLNLNHKQVCYGAPHKILTQEGFKNLYVSDHDNHHDLHVGDYNHHHH